MEKEPRDQDILTRLELLRGDLSCLTVRADLAARKQQPAPQLQRPIATPAVTDKYPREERRPIGIPRKGTMNCWAIVAAQLGRYTPSLYKLTQIDPTMKGLAEFYAAYDAARARGQESFDQPDSQVLSEYFHHAGTGVSLKSYEFEDAGSALMKMMENYPPVLLRRVKDGEILPITSKYTIFPISIIDSKDTPLAALLESALCSGPTKSYFLNRPNELFLQLNRRECTDKGFVFATHDVNVGTRFDLDPKLVVDGQGGAYDCDLFITWQGFHFFLHIKAGDKWYYCNDDRVVEVSDAQAKADIKKAYILHYALKE